MSIKTIPAFIDGASGKIFTLQFIPEALPKAHIVYLPPFCEEMNRCRQLVSRHARLWSESGYSCLIVDLFGTGDSDGKLEDATWEFWLEDVSQCIKHLLGQGSAPVIICGLRLGGLLAADFANSFPEQVNGLVLFQPVTTGKAYLTQILRQRVAFRLNNQLSPETTDSIREMLESGKNVEVAGYTLGNQLTTAIDSKNFSGMTDIHGLPILWLENLSDPENPLPPGPQKVITQLYEQGNSVSTVTLSAPPLWQLHEREPIDAYIDVFAGLELPL